MLLLINDNEILDIINIWEYRKSITMEKTYNFGPFGTNIRDNNG